MNVTEAGAGVSETWSWASVGVGGWLRAERRLDRAVARGSHKSAELCASHRGRPMSDVSTETCRWCHTSHATNHNSTAGI